MGWDVRKRATLERYGRNLLNGRGEGGNCTEPVGSGRVEGEGWDEEETLLLPLRGFTFFFSFLAFRSWEENWKRAFAGQNKQQQKGKEKQRPLLGHPYHSVTAQDGSTWVAFPRDLSLLTPQNFGPHENCYLRCTRTCIVQTPVWPKISNHNYSTSLRKYGSIETPQGTLLSISMCPDFE